VAAATQAPDPPYYTACPNPFLPEIIERWQAERAQIREELGLPDDAHDNGDSPVGRCAGEFLVCMHAGKLPCCKNGQNVVRS